MLGIARRRLGSGRVLRQLMQGLRPVAAATSARSYSTPTKEILGQLNSALDEEMSVDPSVFLMGEEAGVYQGAYKISKGLLDEYGPDKINVPIVFRGPNGAAAGVGAQHLQCYAAWYAHVPGLKVLTPYSTEDARGLLKVAIRDQDPVVFLENQLFYGESFPVSIEVLDSSFCLPIGKAKEKDEDFLAQKKTPDGKKKKSARCSF